MTTASLELSKELYELSGWEVDRVWSMHPKDFEKGLMDGMIIGGKRIEVEKVPTVCLRMGQAEIAPAYDLGYLLKKLPKNVKGGDNWLQLDCALDDDLWRARYADGKDWTFDELLVKLSLTSDTPEDALCKLAIELFKNGVLTK